MSALFLIGLCILFIVIMVIIFIYVSRSSSSKKKSNKEMVAVFAPAKQDTTPWHGNKLDNDDFYDGMF